MRHSWRVAATFILLLAPSLAGAQTETSVPRRSAEELATRFRRAQEKYDVDAMQRLFYGGASDARTRTAVNSMLSQDASHPVRKVFVTPLGPNELTKYTSGGVTYRMTLPPTAKLAIDFLPRDPNGGHYNAEQTTYFIGVRDGAYWLVTAEPKPAPRNIHEL
jgi:hypothetical protein